MYFKAFYSALLLQYCEVEKRNLADILSREMNHETAYPVLGKAEVVHVTKKKIAEATEHVEAKMAPAQRTLFIHLSVEYAAGKYYCMCLCVCVLGH